MTDAPVDLDELDSILAQSEGANYVFVGIGNDNLRRIISELRAARAPVEAWKVAWERVCPEAARAARLGWFDGMNKREGFEAGYLAAQSRAAPPAGLTAEVERLNAAIADAALVLENEDADMAERGDLAHELRVLLASAPPADEVAGLLLDCEALRHAVTWWSGENKEEARTCVEGQALDRLENHLKGKR
jgi:hypothetical protein